MRRPLKLAGLVLAGLLIAIQFIQPERNLSGDSRENDMLNAVTVSQEVAGLLKNSCYDCHSDNTRYPWYSRIAPASWYLNRHIVLGKDALNFSEYGGFKNRKKIGTLSSLCEVLESESMPLKSFLIIHRDAVLDDEEIVAICDWTEAEALNIMQLADSP